MKERGPAQDDSVVAGGVGADLVATRVHLGEATLSYLLFDDKVPDGLVTGRPCPP